MDGQPAISDQKNLIAIEQAIERGIGAVGQGLLEIKEKQLYKLTHKTFEKYCEDRWAFKKSRAYQLIDAEKTKMRLSTMVENVPTKERQLREIAKAPKLEQAAIVAEVQEQCEAEDREPTARDYKQAVAHVLGDKASRTTIAANATQKPKVDAETLWYLDVIKAIKKNKKDTTACASIRDVTMAMFPVAPSLQDMIVMGLPKLAEKEADELAHAILKLWPKQKRAIKSSKLINGFSSDFLLFWDAYPAVRKKSKKKAYAAWNRAIKEGANSVSLIESATEYAKSYVGSGQYSQMPETWLNGGCWEDDRGAWSNAADRAEESSGGTYSNFERYPQ